MNTPIPEKVLSRYQAQLPPDVEQQLHRARERHAAADNRVAALQSDADQARASLLDAEAREAPAKELEPIRRRWHEARQQLGDAQAEAQLAVDVEQRVMDRYLAERHEQEIGEANTKIADARSRYPAAFDRLETAATAVEEAAAALQVIASEEAEGVNRLNRLIGREGEGRRLPAQALSVATAQVGAFVDAPPASDDSAPQSGRRIGLVDHPAGLVKDLRQQLERLRPR